MICQFLLVFLTLLFYDPPFVPPGTVKIGDYYVEASEVTNGNYLDFLFFQKISLDSIAYQRLLPDTSNFWYTMEKYQQKPIVFIGYEQANAYCLWRSITMSEKHDQLITYRLPTIEEWQDIAKKLIKDNRRQIMRELRNTIKVVRKYPDTYYLQSIDDDDKGITNYFDNVSEMTDQKGIAMGASNYYLTDLRNNLIRTVNYTKPNSYIGFRCIATID